MPKILPYYTDDIEYHDPIVDIYGPGTMAEFLGRLFAGSSDLYTTVEDETLVDGVYMATWTMSGEFNGAPFSAPSISIVKFFDGTLQSYYSRDYYTEGDVMLGVPEFLPAEEGFRTYYRSAMDPSLSNLETSTMAIYTVFRTPPPQSSPAAPAASGSSVYPGPFPERVSRPESTRLPPVTRLSLGVRCLQEVFMGHPQRRWSR